MAIFQEYPYATRPASESVSRISSGAYATDDSASEANTGSAIRLGSRVSPSWVLRSRRPMRRRLATSVGSPRVEARVVTGLDGAPAVTAPSAPADLAVAELDSSPCTS